MEHKTYIAEAQSFLADISQAVSLAEQALDGALEEQPTADLSEILSLIDMIESNIFRAQDSIPSRYTEVGEVVEMGEALESYLDDIDGDLRALRSELEELQDRLSNPGTDPSAPSVW